MRNLAVVSKDDAQPPTGMLTISDVAIARHGDRARLKKPFDCMGLYKRHQLIPD